MNDASRLTRPPWICLGYVLVGFICFSAPLHGQEQQGEPEVIGRAFSAADSLTIRADHSPDANQCLEGLAWVPSDFQVVCEKPHRWQYNTLVRFDSPRPSGNPKLDQVAAEWYWGRDKAGNVVRAPAMIIVHESGRGMAVGRLISQLLSSMGLHTFMVQLPGYDLRSAEEAKDVASMMALWRQGIADVRRARDAIAVLPMVDNRHIGIQGTSLGGFIGTLSASLDGGFDSVFLLLSGVDLYGVLQEGDRDAAKIRKQLADAGLQGTALRDVLNSIEPARIAHRLPRDRTWLFSANRDTVVPPKHSIRLAEIAALDTQHHIILDADHYSGIIHLPKVLTQIHGEVQSLHKDGNERSGTDESGD